jgi:hypothetical protein
MKNIYCIVISLVCIVAGFIAGRCTTETVTKTEYIRGEPVSGSISSVEPVRTEKPEISTLPVKIDTIFVNNIRYVVQSVDTSAIIREYEMKRFYSETLFDNQYGKMDVSFNTQYNRASELKYEFIPVTIVKTVEKERVFTPFISVSYGTIGYAGIGGGLFYRNIGAEMKYVTDFKAKGFEFGFLYKF